MDQGKPTQPMSPNSSANTYGSSGKTWQGGIPSTRQQWWKLPQQFWQNTTLAARWILSVGALLLIIGCGTASVVGIVVLQHALAKPDGYMWSDTTDIVFVQFTEDSSNHVTGTWHSVTQESNQAITTQDIGFTGVMNGSHVAFTFSALGASDTIQGTLSGNTLTLQIPDQNGYIATDVFQAASTQDFNNAVSRFRQRITSHIAATQAAQATETSQQADAQATASTQATLDGAVRSANQQLSNDLSNLASDVKSLASNTNFSDALNAYANDWTQMQADYQKEQSDYKQGCGDNGYNAGVVSYDAGTVNYDLGVIQYDDGLLSYDQNAMNSPFNQVQTDIQAVQTDWQNLQGAVTADTTGTAVAQFTANDLNSAIAKAQEQMNASKKALTDAQGMQSIYDSEAAKMNTAAQNLANSMNC